MRPPRDRHAPLPMAAPPSRRWAFGALVENAIDPAPPVDVDDFQELRREGLFWDDGRNPPPSWWAR